MKKIGIITQARFGSTRLPGKILLPIKNKCLLEYHLERLKKTGFSICVATTTLEQEDPILSLCETLQIESVRGSESDVLSRFALAAQKLQCDVIVRVTSDCPFIDSDLIAEGVSEYFFLQETHPQLYYSNTIDRTYARGFDFEIFSAEMLAEADQAATTTFEREHVTPYFYQERSAKIKLLQKKQVFNHSALRVTVDEPKDFELIQVLISQYRADRMSFSQIEKLLLTHPELIAINQQVEQKKV